MSVAASRLAAVGVSIQSPCGVRDHATLLAGALGEVGVECSLHWLRMSLARTVDAVLGLVGAGLTRRSRV